MGLLDHMVALFLGFYGTSIRYSTAAVPTYILTNSVGDPGSITGSGSSPGEEIGHPLQYSWAFLVAQMVKNLPAIQEAWVRSLGWEDPLEEGMATHSSILAWRIPMDRGEWWAAVHEVTKSWTRLSV